MIFIEEKCACKKKVKYEFTYLDYLYYCDRDTWKKIVDGEHLIYGEEDDDLYLAEESTEYTLDEEEQNTKIGKQKHDKIFKDILQNKDEIVQFINKFVEYRIEAENLEIYNPNYITKKFEYKNADIVYKVKDKESYFLIEHQTKVDYSMSYRILNYCLEIIRSVAENKEINRFTYRYPRIVPIVLYTGNKKWSSSNSFAEIQDGESNSEIDNINVKYKLVDVNEYEKEELLKQKQELKRIAIYLYGDEEEKIIEEIIKILEERECEANMSTVAERIRRELANDRRIVRAEGMMIGIKEGIDQGISQGISQGIGQGVLQTIKQIVEQMIKMNFEDATIKQVTGAKKTEIEKIRKEMNEKISKNT